MLIRIFFGKKNAKKGLKWAKKTLNMHKFAPKNHTKIQEGG